MISQQCPRLIESEARTYETGFTEDLTTKSPFDTVESVGQKCGGPVIRTPGATLIQADGSSALLR